jgi:hypothetical protein
MNEKRLANSFFFSFTNTTHAVFAEEGCSG